MPRPTKSKNQREAECRRVYEFIIETAKLHGSGTTIRDIINNTGIRCYETVKQYVDELEVKNLIKRIPGKARTIVPNRGLSLEGYVGAGGLIEKDDNREQSEMVDLFSGLEKRNNYILIVTGNSMIDAGILDGDYVIVKKQSFRPENGQIVVAVHKYPYSATIKRFYLEKERVILKPANSEMESRLISSKEWEEEWLIEGIVVAVIRQYDHSVKKYY